MDIFKKLQSWWERFVSTISIIFAGWNPVDSRVQGAPVDSRTAKPVDSRAKGFVDSRLAIPQNSRAPQV
jgi:hypothetical protein